MAEATTRIGTLLTALGMSPSSFDSLLEWTLSEHLVAALSARPEYDEGFFARPDALRVFRDVLVQRTGRAWSTEDLEALFNRVRATKTKHYREPVPHEEYLKLLWQVPLECVRCKRGPPEVELHIDHVVPVTHGGTSRRPNLQFLCAEHNLRKSSKREVGIFVRFILERRALLSARRHLSTISAGELAEGQVESCMAIGLHGHVLEIEDRVARLRLVAAVMAGAIVMTWVAFVIQWNALAPSGRHAFFAIQTAYIFSELVVAISHLAPRLRAAALGSSRLTPQSTFGLFELFLPRRITSEQFGDASELIVALERRGAPRWQVWVKVASTVGWVLVDAARELRKTLF